MDNQSYQITRCKHCGSYIPADWDLCGRCGRRIKKTSRRGKWGWLMLALMILFAAVYREKLFSLLPKQVQERIAHDFSSIFSPAATGTQEPFIRNINDTDRDTNPVTDSDSDRSPDVNSPKPTDKVIATPVTQANASIDKDEIYNRIHEALRNGAESVKLPVYDSDLIFQAIRQIVLDDPMVLYYDGCSYRSDGLLTFKYNRSRNTIREDARALQQKADEILKKIIRPGMSDFEKELAIHDYIINNCRYDTENLEKNTLPPESYNASGPLLKGIAVCEGYAKAVKLLLDGAGIESYVVTGTSKGESHAWNIVKIGGHYYHLDATWNDPVMQSGEQTLQYTYFNLPDKDIKKDHSWEAGALPDCNATEYNYYVYNNLTVSSPQEFIDKAVSIASKSDSAVTIRIMNYSADKYVIPELIKKIAIELNVRNVSYSVNEAFGVVDAWFGKR